MAICLLVTFSNCSSDNDNKESNPLINPKYSQTIAKEPAWVETKITESKDLSIYVIIDKGTYNDNTVYIFSSCCPLCDAITLYYDKDGNPVEVASYKDVTDVTPLYRGTDCTPIE